MGLIERAANTIGWSVEATRTTAYAGASALGLLAGGLTLRASADQVNESERGIVTTWGKVERVVDSGLAFHWPWQAVTKLNTQAQTIEIPLEVYSKDAQLAPKNVVTVTFHLPPESVAEVYSKYGPKYFETVLKYPTENIFRECFGRMTADQIIADRDLLNAQVRERLEKEFKNRSVVLEGLAISVGFNEAFNKSAEESAIARTKVNTAKQNLERKEIEAKQTVIDAKAEADATLARKTAEAKGLEAVGAAEAKVVELKTAAFRSNPDYPRLVAAERWDGKLPATMVPGQAVPFIELTTPARQSK